MITLPNWIFDGKASTLYGSFLDEGEDTAKAMIQNVADLLKQESVDAMDRVVRLGARDLASIHLSQVAMEVLCLDLRIIWHCYSGYYDMDGYTGVTSFNHVSAMNGALVTEWNDGDVVPACCTGDVWNTLTKEQRKKVRRVVTRDVNSLEDRGLARELIVFNIIDSVKYRSDDSVCHDFGHGFPLWHLQKFEEARVDESHFAFNDCIETLLDKTFGKLKRLKVKKLVFELSSGAQCPSGPAEMRAFMDEFEKKFEVLEYSKIFIESGLPVRPILVRDYMQEWITEDTYPHSDWRIQLNWSNRKPMIFNGVEMPFSEVELLWA